MARARSGCGWELPATATRASATARCGSWSWRRCREVRGEAPRLSPVLGAIPGPFVFGRDPDLTTFEPTNAAGEFAISFKVKSSVALDDGDSVTMCIEVIGAKLTPVNG